MSVPTPILSPSVRPLGTPRGQLVHGGRVGSVLEFRASLSRRRKLGQLGVVFTPGAGRLAFKATNIHNRNHP